MCKTKSNPLSLSLSLSRSRFRPRIILLGVFFLCVCVGVVAGSYIRYRVGDANAAGENIIVANNNQVSTVDQGTPQIVRTSTVTVKDTAATAGYTLSARVENNSIANSTVTIGSAGSTMCTLASPCTITSDIAPTTILETDNNNAAQSQGETMEWTVTISLPGGTAQGNYILDIAYGEEPIISPPTLLDMAYMQDLALPENTQGCADTPDRTRTILIDRRNDQPYYVEKIGDLCWMETNLRYAGNGNYDSTWNYPDDRYATAANNTTANLNDNIRPLTLHASGLLDENATSAKYMNPGGSTTLNIANPTSNTTFYGYLYSWCAAMGGQNNACNTTSTTGFDAATSICPAGWRLFTGNYGEEFNIMADVIGGVVNLRSSFLAAYSGLYAWDLLDQGSRGDLWSFTSTHGTGAYNVSFDASYIGYGASNHRAQGRAVRCVLD